MEKSKNFRQLLKNMFFEWKWLFGFIVNYKWTLFLYIILGVVGTGMSLGVSVSTKYLIDSVIDRDKDVLLGAIAFLAGFAISQILFQALSSWVTSVVSSKAHNEIRTEIYSHVLNSSVSDMSKFHSGDLLNRLESDVSTVSSAVISFIPNVFTRSLQFFGSLLLVLYYDKTMALLALMSAPLMFLSSRVLIKTIRKYNKATRELNGEILAYSEESVQNLQLIKAFDITRDYISKFKLVLENYRSVRLSSDKFSIFMTMVLSFAGLIVSYACYGWGVYRLWQGVITYGTMTLFLQVSGSLTSSFGSLASLAPSSISIATAAGRVMEITSFREELDEEKEKALSILDKCRKDKFKLVLDNVSFSYDDKSKPVLQDVSLTIDSGETIGFVGPSGEGKTTLFKLILGLINPTEGRIYIKISDGDEITISDSTRRFCSYVPQHITAFSGSVRDNLTIVKNNADISELESVLQKAELFDYISELPEGIDTSVKEQGGNMSQGQLQRLSIARALLRDASILLMDEATSALDTETETAVLKNIMCDNDSKITMLTTHRESMLTYCDKVYKILSDGRITF